MRSGSSGGCGQRRCRGWTGEWRRSRVRRAGGLWRAAPKDLVMQKLDLYSSNRLVEGLGIVFYVGMATALLTALLGSPGWAFLLLVFGSCALVVRTALESAGPRGTASD